MFGLRPRRVAPPTIVALAEREVLLRVRESARARRITLRIDAAAEAIELVLPKRVSLAGTVLLTALVAIGSFSVSI